MSFLLKEKSLDFIPGWKNATGNQRSKTSLDSLHLVILTIEELLTSSPCISFSIFAR